MDRSLDSIGSCSLDVDADSSDISDTSGSLNFPTPLSVKDITREFTNNLRERCTLRSPVQPQHTTTAFLDSGSGLVRMVLSPVVVESVQDSKAVSVDVTVDVCGTSSPEVAAAAEKKPSYLNLACCVNGYSNLNTYDSKIRQDINKSREVSPIRPSTSGLQYCKRKNSLAAPILHSMPLVTQPSPTSKRSLIESNNKSNGHSLENGSEHSNGNGSDSHGVGATSSFIRQRVERLYGPGALAQGFYSPKKSSQTSLPASSRAANDQLEVESQQCSELARKFKQLSPSKDYGEFRKKLSDNCFQTATARLAESSPPLGKNGDVDLPVFRHLSHEFRAQLPTVSPKRGVSRAPSAQKDIVANGESHASDPVDVVDHEPVKIAQLISDESNNISKIEIAATVRDGNYFLKILKGEQTRLMALAALAEKYSDALDTNPDITEDTFGLLRSASGKARLLATQKMKQFEGLCHNNLNRSPEDEFPTTLDDLQGFWDMVYLQVAHVDNIFADIEQLKANDWKQKVQPHTEAVPTKTIKAAKTAATKTTRASNNSSVNGSKLAAANSAAALKREAQRKLLLEMKRQRREALAASTKGNQVVSDSTTELPTTIGDGSANTEIKNSS
ncbi:hypothetical protein KR009_008974 [Drosophila setifemur]|nr:hypothetical protein KR009_008974 [Drosophila setifemur]